MARIQRKNMELRKNRANFSENKVSKLVMLPELSAFRVTHMLE